MFTTEIIFFNSITLFKSIVLDSGLHELTKTTPSRRDLQKLSAVNMLLVGRVAHGRQVNGLGVKQKIACGPLSWGLGVRLTT
jgi:hypothetical protein